MHRQLPSTLAPWARSRALQAAAARRSVQPAWTGSVRSLSAYASRPAAADSPASGSSAAYNHPRLFSSTSILPATFSPSQPVLAGRKKGGRSPPHEEDGEADEGAVAKDGETKLDGRTKPPGNPSESSPASAAGASSSGASDDPSSAGSAPPPDDATTATTSISKRSVPDVYPQVLALPITRRPLFPGFYKAVVIRNPDVVAAIKDSIKRGQPYIGAFLLKDENSDSDMCVFGL